MAKQTTKKKIETPETDVILAEIQELKIIIKRLQKANEELSAELSKVRNGK